ncbi:MAG: phage tail tube protein [Cyanobacteria bacterium P01_C01_bin.120]
MVYTLPTGKNRVLVGAAGHAPTRGNTTDIFLGLLPLGVRTAPTQQQLTVGTGGTALDATSINVTETISALIPANSFLQFYNLTTGEEYLAQLTADVSSGSVLAVKALGEAIPEGAVASNPGYLWDRSDASVDRSYNRATTQTFNTGGDEDGVITGASRTMTLPGIFYAKNAGYLNALWAAENGREVYVQRVIGGRVDMEGPCVVTAAPSAAPVDGNVSADLTLAFQGKPVEGLLA